MCKSHHLVLGFLAMVAATPVWGHATRLSSTRMVRSDEAVTAVVTLNPRDLEAALGLRLRGTGSDGADRQRVQRAAAEISAYVTARAVVSTRDGGACRAEAGTPDVVDGHAVLTLLWRCPSIHRGLIYRVRLFHEIDPAARHMVIFARPAGRFALLDAAVREVSISAGRGSLVTVVWRYLLAGIEHIAIGYDHIAFVIGVVLWGRRLWSLVGVVTAFTLAHSLTLTLAVLDVVSLPSAWVETAIAASIVYVGAENFFVRNISGRWRLTFAFGLVHGFGFAGALKQFGLPVSAMAPALAAFNIGVEIGQIAIVFAVVLGLLLWDRVGLGSEDAGVRRRTVVFSVSAGILLLGLVLLVARLGSALHFPWAEI